MEKEDDAFIEVHLISAQDLEPPPLANMCRTKIYAPVWFDPTAKLRSRVDRFGSENPTWNDKFFFRVTPEVLAMDTSAVTLEIYAVGDLPPEYQAKKDGQGRGRRDEKRKKAEEEAKVAADLPCESLENSCGGSRYFSDRCDSTTSSSSTASTAVLKEWNGTRELSGKSLKGGGGFLCGHLLRS